MSGEPNSTAPSGEAAAAAGHAPLLAALLAWAVPGLGHLYLGRRGRAVAFCLIVVISLLTGLALEGNLYTVVADQPLSFFATLGSMGIGAAYFILRWGLGYQGELEGPGYEYGSAFILTAGLMNLLLVLDALDIARGRKS